MLASRFQKPKVNSGATQAHLNGREKRKADRLPAARVVSKIFRTFSGLHQIFGYGNTRALARLLSMAAAGRIITSAKAVPGRCAFSKNNAGWHAMRIHSQTSLFPLLYGP